MATDLTTDPNEAVTTYIQPTAKPTAKVRAVGVAGGAVAAIVTILALFGVIIPEELSSQAEAAVTAVIVAITFAQALIQFVAGYLKKSDTKVGTSKTGL